MKEFTLLTGSTGLLGHYLLRDLLAKGLRVAVVARPSKTSDARSRVDSIMSRWDRIEGRYLARPVVLTGDLSSPGIGISREERVWLEKNCRAVVHNAASLSFTTGGSRTEEPWLGNVGGTTNLTSFARELGIPRFHHVSTAYTCGLRTGTVYETESNLGQKFGNDYEESKLEAENIVHDAGFPESPTFFRPAIIVGDSRTSFTSTYHGFYTPLRVMASFMPMMQGMPPIPESMWMMALGLHGHECKNLVPVDWVSKVIAHIVSKDYWHGRTYHLTPANRVLVQDIAAVTKQAIIEQYGKEKRTRQVQAQSSQVLESLANEFRNQMETYSAYWRDDPHFDASNTLEAASELLCPSVDVAMLRRLCGFALRENFGWPRPIMQAPEFDVATKFAPTFSAQRVSGWTEQKDSRCIDFEVSGPGGGNWSVWADGKKPRVGFPQPGRGPRVRTSSQALMQISGGSLTAKKAFQTGQLIVSEGEGDPYESVQVIHKMFFQKETVS